MVVVAVAAGLFALSRSYPNLVYVFVLSTPLALGGLAWWVCWGRPRVALWGLASTSILACVVTAWFCVYPLPMLGIHLIYACMIATLPPLAACGGYWMHANRRRDPKKRSPWTQVAVILLGILPSSMALTLWPLHLAFAISRPAMNRLADQVAAGIPVAFPCQVGVYTIVSAKRDLGKNPDVALFVDDDPNGPSGFVRSIEPRISFGHDLIVPSNYSINLDWAWDYRDED